MKERYIATLIGCGTGDTLGMCVEGWKKTQIERHVGRITEMMDPVLPVDAEGNRILEDEDGKLKCYTQDFKKGEFTDDTIFSLAIADAIIKSGKIDLDTIAKHQLHAYTSRKRPDGTVHGGFGRTTTAAMKNLEQGIPPTRSGVIGGPGNAPSMEIPAVGLYMHATGSQDSSLLWAEKIARITHLDPRSVASGVCQAYAIDAVLRDVKRQPLLNSIASVCQRFEKPLTEEFSLSKKGTLAQRLQWVRDNPDVEDIVAYETLGCSSVVYRSYPFAIWMFQKYWDNPIEGLIETVNYGGDCDTTGAMYGALVGAKNGMIFPDNWLNDLKNKEQLIDAAEGIYRLRK